MAGPDRLDGFAEGRRVDGREPVQLGLDRSEQAPEPAELDEPAVEHGLNIGAVLVEAALELGERLR